MTNYQVYVTIENKPGISDPEGKTILNDLVLKGSILMLGILKLLREIWFHLWCFWISDRIYWVKQTVAEFFKDASQNFDRIFAHKSSWIFLIKLAYQIHTFIGDFWQNLYSDKYLWYLVGPATILSIIVLIPAYLGTLFFINGRHIKYVF